MIPRCPARVARPRYSSHHRLQRSRPDPLPLIPRPATDAPLVREHGADRARGGSDRRRGRGARSRRALYSSRSFGTSSMTTRISRSSQPSSRRRDSTVVRSFCGRSRNSRIRAVLDMNCRATAPTSTFATPAWHLPGNAHRRRILVVMSRGTCVRYCYPIAWR